MPTYIPPAAVADNAREALAQREKKPASERGMTAVGLARARQLANRQPVSIEIIQRMISYFARHEIDKTGSSWDTWGKGRQAWNGWGGDSGRDWANTIMKEYNAMGTKEVKAGQRHSQQDMQLIRQLRGTLKSGLDLIQQLGDDGADHSAPVPMNDSMKDANGLTEPQMLLQESYTAIVSEVGKFSQGLDGAHYMGPDVNAFADSGLVCRNCVFWQSDTGVCEIVDGMIQPGAICKLWIIPQSLITDSSNTMMEDDSMMEDNAEEPVNIEIEVAALQDRNTTPKQRESMPAGDFVIPESRNFPVVTPADIPAAVSSWGRYRGPITFDVFKQRMIRLAQRKGAEFVAALPQQWQDEMNAKSNALREMLYRD